MTDTKLKRVGQLILENKVSLMYVLILNLLMLIPAAVSPIFRKVFTDNIMQGGMDSWLPTLLMLMVFIACFSAALVLLQKIILVKLANKVELTGAGNYMWQLFHAPMSLFSGSDTSQLLAKADSAKSVSAILTVGLVATIFTIINLIMYFMLMFSADRSMTLIVVALVIFTYVVSQLQAQLVNKLKQRGTTTQQGTAQLAKYDQLISARGIESIESIKSTSAEMTFFQRLMSIKIANVHSKRVGDYVAAAAPINGFSSMLFLNLLLLAASLRIMDQTFTIGGYLAFQAYAVAFFAPLNAAIGLRKQFKGYEASLDGYYSDLSQTLDYETVNEQQNINPGSGKLAGHIELKNVTFGYDPARPVIKDFSLEIKPGERVAVLGKSGAGKTTLIKLLQGLYVPDSGEILIDGIPLQKIDRNLLAASVGSANQKIQVFTATMHDNITLWDDSITDSDVYAAASDACLHEHITSLNGAYQYQLSENGRNLSGGQKQRLEIARAFVNKPSIVLVDEVTSSLDPATSDRIQHNLLARGCTVFMVTHVIGSVLDYDKIIVLDDGQIQSAGSHRSLLKSSEYYKSLFQSEGWMMS